MSTVTKRDADIVATAAKATADQVIDRLKEAAEFKTDAELAAALDVSKSTIANWRKRNSVRWDRLLPIARDKGIPVDYLTTGRFSFMEGVLPKLDIDFLATIFRVLADEGYLKLPARKSDGDAAERAAMEFRTLETRAASLLIDLLNRNVTPSDAREIVFRQLRVAPPKR